MIRSGQTGDSGGPKPGTSLQTGNSSPKFDWKGTKKGRTALVLVLCIAYRLGYTDDDMGRARKFPRDLLWPWFLKMAPWFPAYHTEFRRSKLNARTYRSPVYECGPNHVYNRLLYMFAEPGSAKADPRRYGISKEHPFSTRQRGAQGLGEVWDRCSVEISNRLLEPEPKPITEEEAETWGRFF